MRYLTVLLLAAVALPAHATTARRLELSELVGQSTVVVLGRAGRHSSYWQGGRILTRTELEVEEVLSGPLPAGKTLEVVTMGGVVGDIGQRVDGAALLPQGGRVVLCLTRGRMAGADAGAYRVVGMAQGAFLVAGEPGGPELLKRRTGGARLVGRDSAAPMPRTLAELRRAVREMARGAGK